MAPTTAAEVAMPRLSDSMEEGTIIAWHKQVGDQVAVGEELAEIETDKANMAYESELAGTLLEVLVAAGETAAVGAPIARVGEAGASVAQPPALPAVEADGARPRTKASPLARRFAEEVGIDLGSVQGSGPGGRITKKDVEGSSALANGAPVSPPPPATASPAPDRAAASLGARASETARGEVVVEEISKLQGVVARRMAESKATAPHFYLTAEVDMAAAVAARARIKAHLTGEEEVVPSFNDMIVKACAIALRRFPRANGAYRDGRFELYSRVNVGIAVAAENALVVPTVFDADRKGLSEIASEARALASRVRDGSVTPPELAGATFTVSNLGMFGVRGFGAIVNSPQAGILAVGEIADRPVVKDGAVVPGKLMEITLSCDHRILYGADGAEFLGVVKRLLEEPIGLAL